MGFEVAGSVVGWERKKLMFNPQVIYNSQTSSPVQPNVEFWLKVNIGKSMVELMGFVLSGDL